MSIRFPKHCKTRAQKSAHAKAVASIRWERHHAALSGEPIRKDRILATIIIQRSEIDPKPVSIQIMDDGVHRRRKIREDDLQWFGVHGRSALVSWFDQLLKSAGV
jgi:hypothetical protein